MAEQRIVGRDGTITIISDSWAPFGTLSGPPTPAEDSSKWKVVKWKYDDVITRYGWGDDDYAQARARCGFPEPRNKELGRAHMYWSAEKVLEWEAGIRTMAARLPKR